MEREEAEDGDTPRFAMVGGVEVDSWSDLMI